MRPSMTLAVSLALLATAPWSRAQEAGSAEAAASPALTAESAIADWPRASRLIARTMIEKYGQPAEVSEGALLWRQNGPWKRTLVYRAPPPYWSSASDADVLQQVVTYRVPLEKFTELTLFDTRLKADRARTELSFRSDSEKLNFLALNLAYDIIIGEKDAAQARLFFAQAAELAQAGKSSPYCEGLRFQAERPRLTIPY